MTLPPPPARSFASDNAAGAHPRVLEALAAANDGHALAYGADPWTARVEDLFRELFGRPVESFLVWGGTGANVMALTSLVGPGDAVVCSDGAHINVDETGAPERIAGTKLMDLPASEGKLVPAQLEELEHLLGVEHHAQPAVLSITQSTELGTLYTAGEVAALTDTAHRMGMKVHLDGARIANATAALGGDVDALRSFTIDAGVDVISFGVTKAGAVYGEAVVYLDPALARRARFVRKAVTQLPSKMRFVAAQLDALLADGLWIELGTHANAMAALLHDRVHAIPGVVLDAPPQVNSLFPVLPAEAIRTLQDWCFFWDWDPSRHQVRWMTAWDTTADDIERFARGVQQVVAGKN